MNIQEIKARAYDLRKALDRCEQLIEQEHIVKQVLASKETHKETQPCEYPTTEK